MLLSEACFSSQDHHGRVPPLPTRHDAVLARLIDALPRLVPEGSLLLVGSGASNAMDELSDLDMILAVPEGTFTRAWDTRHTLSAHALWRDDAPESQPDGPGVHKWLSREVVLVEVLFVPPPTGRLRVSRLDDHERSGRGRCRGLNSQGCVRRRSDRTAHSR